MLSSFEFLIDDIVLSGAVTKRVYNLAPNTPGGIVMCQKTSGVPSSTWHHYDGIGNVATESTGLGVMSSGFDQEAFGLVYGIFDNTGYYHHGSKNGIPITNAMQHGRHQTTKSYDSRTHMYYFNFRWYDPVIGRFTQQEPLGIDGPNQYHFCFNNPVNGFDPNGLFAYPSHLIYQRQIETYRIFTGVPYNQITQIEVRTSCAWGHRIGYHAFLHWPEHNNLSAGMNFSFGRGNPSDHGQHEVVDAYPIVCTRDEAGSIMNYCIEHANDGLYIIGYNDCHNAVIDALNTQGYSYPPGITRINEEFIEEIGIIVEDYMGNHEIQARQYIIHSPYGPPWMFFE